MKKHNWTALYPVGYRILYVLLLAGILIMGFGRFLGIRNLGNWHWFLVLVLLALFVWIQYGRIKEKIIGAALLIIAVLVLIPYIGAGRIDGFFENYYHWIVLRKDFCEEWVIGYELMQILWVVSGCYLFQLAAQKNNVVKEAAAGVLFSTLLLCMFRKIEIDHVGVAFIICYIVSCVTEWIRRGWEKRKAPDKQGYLIWLAPFLVIYILLMSIIPVKEEPYDWALAKRIYSNLREKVVTWMEDISRNGNEDFAAFLTGFSEESGLFGGFSESNREVMTITGTDGLMTNLYLSGKTYDTFDGREWKQTIAGNPREFPMDALETLYAVKRHESRWLSNYVRSTRISLKYGSFDTGYLFVPLKPSYFYNVEYEINGGDYIFGEQKGYGTAYDIAFYQMNLRTADFLKLMEAKPEEDAVEWMNTVNRYAPEGYKALSLEDLEIYRQSMKYSYSREVALSKPVQEYLQEITGEAAAPYTRLLAIEQELAGYVYTDHPGKLPGKVDSAEAFLDYFLLESKQGYCSYFATAFVLLAQAEGLPARYVEGFCVPTNPRVSETIVYSNMAHAWPEVYFEGIGWIPFEPTPGYGELRYQGWLTQKPVEEETQEEENLPFCMPTPTPIPQEELLDKEGGSIWNQILVVCKVVAIVLLFLAIILLLERIRQRIRYSKMSGEEKFLVEVKRNLRLFARLDCRRRETETLSELQEQIRETLPELMVNKTEWQFLKGYEEYLYRKAEVSDALLQESIEEREQILEWLKESNRGYYYVIRVWLFLTS